MTQSALAEDWSSDPSSQLQSFVTLALEDLTLSFGLCGHYTHVHKPTHRHIQIHIIKNKIF